MAYTGHGHHIPGSNKGEGMLAADRGVSRCGGVDRCPRCKQDVDDYRESMVGSDVDYQQRAKEIVRKYWTPMQDPTTPPFEIYVEWFTKTLRNWKAIVGTTLEDCMLFVVTHDGQNNVTYVTAYHQVDNKVIPD